MRKSLNSFINEALTHLKELYPKCVFDDTEYLQIKTIEDAFCNVGLGNKNQIIRIIETPYKITISTDKKYHFKDFDKKIQNITYKLGVKVIIEPKEFEGRIISLSNSTKGEGSIRCGSEHYNFSNSKDRLNINDNVNFVLAEDSTGNIIAKDVRQIKKP